MSNEQFITTDWNSIVFMFSGPYNYSNTIAFIVNELNKHKYSSDLTGINNLFHWGKLLVGISSALKMKIWIYWSNHILEFIFIYAVLNKNWKIYWFEQSFTGLGVEYRCSLWWLSAILVKQIVKLIHFVICGLVCIMTINIVTHAGKYSLGSKYCTPCLDCI